MPAGPIPPADSLQGHDMTRRYSGVLWSARILAIGVCVFLGVFALDAWEPGKPFSQALTDVLVHLLPAAVVLASIALSWHRPWIGGLAFVSLAVAYAVVARFRLDWVLAISGPLLAVGVLLLWSWRKNSRLTPS